MRVLALMVVFATTYLLVLPATTQTGALSGKKDGVEVHIEADDGALVPGTSLLLKKVLLPDEMPEGDDPADIRRLDAGEVEKILEAAKGGDASLNPEILKVLDISLDLDGEEEEPLQAVRLTLKSDLIKEASRPVIVHLTDDGVAELLDADLNEDVIGLRREPGEEVADEDDEDEDEAEDEAEDEEEPEDEKEPEATEAPAESEAPAEETKPEPSEAPAQTRPGRPGKNPKPSKAPAESEPSAEPETPAEPEPETPVVSEPEEPAQSEPVVEEAAPATMPAADPEPVAFSEGEISGMTGSFSVYAIVDLGPGDEEDEEIDVETVEFTGSVDGFDVFVTAPVTAFPEDTWMELELVPEENVIDEVSQVLLIDNVGETADDIMGDGEDLEPEETNEVNIICAVDITFYHYNEDGEKEEIEPLEAINVVIKPVGEDETFVAENPAVVHIGETETNVVNAVFEEDQVSFDSDAFSVYVVADTGTSVQTVTVKHKGDDDKNHVFMYVGQKVKLIADYTGSTTIALVTPKWSENNPGVVSIDDTGKENTLKARATVTGQMAGDVVIECKVVNGPTFNVRFYVHVMDRSNPTITVPVYATDGYAVKSPVRANNTSEFTRVEKAVDTSDLMKFLNLKYMQDDGYYPIGVINLPLSLFQGQKSPYINSNDDFKKVIAALEGTDFSNTSISRLVNKGTLNAGNKVGKYSYAVFEDWNQGQGDNSTALFDWTGGKEEHKDSVNNGGNVSIIGDYAFHLDLLFATGTVKFEGTEVRDDGTPEKSGINLGSIVWLANTLIREPAEMGLDVGEDWIVEGFYEDADFTKVANLASEVNPNPKNGITLGKGETKTIYCKITKKPTVDVTKSAVVSHISGSNLEAGQKEGDYYLAGLGDTITYTVTVINNRGDSVTANGVLVHDDMLKDPTLKNETVTVSGDANKGNAEVPIEYDEKGSYVSVDVPYGNTGVTITYKHIVNEDDIALDSDEEEKLIVNEVSARRMEEQGSAKTNVKVAMVKSYRFDLYKVDGSNNDAPLEGVEFILTNGAGEQLLKKTTGEDGKVSFSGLAEGTYTLTESGPLDGYLAAGEMTVTITKDPSDAAGYKLTGAGTGYWGNPAPKEVTENGKNINVYEIAVTNVTGNPLPHTGGMGTMLFTIGGVGLMMGAIYVGLQLAKTRKRGGRA